MCHFDIRVARASLGGIRLRDQASRHDAHFAAVRCAFTADVQFTMGADRIFEAVLGISISWLIAEMNFEPVSWTSPGSSPTSAHHPLDFQ